MEKKKKCNNAYGVKDVITYYNKNYINSLTIKEASKILNLFNNKLIEEIYKGAYITMPYSLGDIYINKYKRKLSFDKDGNIIIKNKYKMIDYKATKELWKEHPELKGKQNVLYDNFHTDGYKFRIQWKRYHTIRENKIYNFTPSRYFSRGLAAYLRKNPNQSYYGK